MASRRWWCCPAWPPVSSSRRSAAWAPLRGEQREFSASTTTKSLTRRRTCNTSPGSADPGSASTGGTTAVWSQAPCHSATGRLLPWTLTGLSPDQQFQAGLFCGSQYTQRQRRRLVPILVPSVTYRLHPHTVPAPGTENDDHNPPRIAPRHLFDLAVGDDNLFHGDRYKWSASVTVDQPDQQIRRCTTSFRPSAARTT